MNASAWDEDLLIEAEEFGMCEPFPGFGSSQLGVGEGEPDLGHFTGLEIGGKTIDLGTEEGGVGKVFPQTCLCADVDAIAFQVYAQKIPLGVHPGQSDGVFSFTAGQLQGEGTVIFEEFRPFSRHAFRVLEDVGEGEDRRETDQFFLAHGAKLNKVVHRRRDEILIKLHMA